MDANTIQDRVCSKDDLVRKMQEPIQKRLSSLGGIRPDKMNDLWNMFHEATLIAPMQVSDMVDNMSDGEIWKYAKKPPVYYVIEFICEDAVDITYNAHERTESSDGYGGNAPWLDRVAPIYTKADNLFMGKSPSFLDEMTAFCKGLAEKGYVVRKDIFDLPYCDQGGWHARILVGCQAKTP